MSARAAHSFPKPSKTIETRVSHVGGHGEEAMGVYAWGRHGSRSPMGAVMGRRPSGYIQESGGGGEEDEEEEEEEEEEEDEDAEEEEEERGFT